MVGDYNNNGKVDAADYVLWRNNVGTTTVLPNDPGGRHNRPYQYNNGELISERRSGGGQQPGG